MSLFYVSLNTISKQSLICHYFTLVLLMLASQRIETDIFGNSSPAGDNLNTTKRLLIYAFQDETDDPTISFSVSYRGALPSPIELFILAWVLGKEKT